ncbi:hypothetical protein G7Y89_g4186 [Cudoniella acicularis]|uniref:Cytochrome P450 n=1 Tax=Cudoniella acicularis TaxID=354080 RepID=A0A8H4W588_9HELO|nr:hypothetical protein G7Y89_g4186 [Cudoniella acicularis]
MISSTVTGLTALAMGSTILAQTQNCVLQVPNNFLTAEGLATPYKMTGCNQTQFADEGCFVDAAILDPATGDIQIYNPLVINQDQAVKGKDFIAPVVPTLPENAVVGIWFGSNAVTLTLTGDTVTCVNGDGNSVFGQFAYCNTPAFFEAATKVVSAGLLKVPPPSTTTKAAQRSVCLVTRGFRMVDMDQSDNVDSTYLLINGSVLAQNTKENAANNKNATEFNNGSDNLLLNAFLAPTLGCTPFTAPLITSSSGELQSQLFPPVGGPALVPLNDDFAIIAANGNVTQSLVKTNLYRAGVGRPPAKDLANASSVTYCQRYAESGLFTGGTSPAPAASSNLFTFMANRFATSFGPTTIGDCIVVAATINTKVLQDIVDGKIKPVSTTATSTTAASVVSTNLSVVTKSAATKSHTTKVATTLRTKHATQVCTEHQNQLVHQRNRLLESSRLGHRLQRPDDIGGFRKRYLYSFCDSLNSFLLYHFSRAIYNVFFHPLRHFPGPLLARASRLMWSYHTFNGDLTKYTTECHRKYGDTVRIAPNELSYTKSEAWPDIYGHRLANGQGNLPKPTHGRRPPVNGVNSMIAANEEDHRRMRRLQSHMFSEKALAAQEPLITTYIDLLVSRLHEQARTPETNIVDIVKWYNYTTFDILGDLAFGDSFGCLKSDVLHPWITNIFQAVKDASFFRAAYGSTEKQFAFASAKAKERLSQGSTDRADFMSYILRYNDEKGMTVPEIESNASLLIIAGSETTATFLSGITYHLLSNPPVLKQLTDLIRTTFPSEKDINILSIQHLEYFTACLEEGFRTYPPVPTGVPRITTAEGNIICNTYVPPNTIVAIPQYTLYSSPKNWTDPEKFVPERWLKDPPERYAHDNKKAMQPFSIGPRNCIGRNLAYAEMRLILARVLWNFDFELQPDSQHWTSQKIYGLWEKIPLNVKLIPRVFTEA